MSNRFKLTTFSKVLIIIAVLAIIGGGIGIGMKKGIITTEKKPDKTTISEIKTDSEGNVINTDKKDDESTINLSLDEWIGWKEIIDANGGLSTKSGSIYDKLGIKVNISIINDATQSSNALINNNLDAAGYTINRVAFLSNKFKTANFDVIMPYITNFSNGGDGIIAKSNIKTVSDLIDAKVGVPQFSEAHSLVVWFVNQSDLKSDEKKKIIDNLIFFETPDEAAKAFFAGQIDVAATWEPYLTQAKNMSDAHVLFDTSSSSSLIMDGILFSKKFAEANPEVVTKFIDGALQASSMYETDLTTIKSVMPMFSTASDTDIKDNCVSAKLMTYGDNLKMFNSTAKNIYTDMCKVWKSISEETNMDLVDTLFDPRYISALDTKYDKAEVTENKSAKVTEENKKSVTDTVALLQKSTSVNFIKSTAKFTDSAEAAKALDEFIKIANVLDGAIIEIAGNTDPNPNSDPTDELNKRLSQSRAEAVKNYFIMNGISADRIITIGNGSSNPVVKNDSEEHRAMNRRTDISFKMIEQ